MLRHRILLAGCVLAAGSLLVQAQENDLKDIIRKSITAHGGKEKLSKFKGAKTKFKGNIELMGMKIPVTGETTFLMPNKIKNDLTLDIMGKQVPLITVYDGKTMWVSQLGNTMEVKDEKILKETRDSLQAEGAGTLVTILDGTYELSSVGEAKVKDKDAVGIRVSKKDQRDYTLFFDKKTHLIVKTEMRAFDSIGKQEVTQEKYLLDFKDRNGIQSPGRVVVEQDGKLFMDFEITDAQTFETLEDANFAMP